MNIVLFEFVFVLSNEATAQTGYLHEKTLQEMVKQTSGVGDNPHVDVGKGPNAIAINEKTNTV